MHHKWQAYYSWSHFWKMHFVLEHDLWLGIFYPLCALVADQIIPITWDLYIIKIELQAMILRKSRAGKFKLLYNESQCIKFRNIGSVALLWRNAKHNVNPGLNSFEQRSLACAHLLANSHLRFAFRQSKATLPFFLC